MEKVEEGSVNFEDSRVLIATDDGNYVGFHDIVSMSTPRSDHTVVLFDHVYDLNGARMYISGGCSGIQEVKTNQLCQSWSNTPNEYKCIKTYCTAITASTVYFSPETSKFTSVSDDAPGGARYRAAAAGVGTKLYIFGGRTLPSPLDGDDSSLVVTKIDILDTTTNKWVTPALEVGQGPAISLLVADVVSDGGAFSFGNYIYLVGGYVSGYSTLSSLIRIDTSQSTWVVNTMAPMTTARGDITVQLFKGEFYVMGGWNPFFSAALNTVESYKPNPDPTVLTGGWTTRPDMMYERGDLAAGVISNALFAIAGEQRDEAKDPSGDKMLSFPVQWVTKFTLTSNKFVVEAPLPVNRFRFVGASYNSTTSYLSSAVYLFGGQSDYDDGCKCFKTVASTLKYIPASTYTPQFTKSKLSDGQVAGIIIGTVVSAGLIFLGVVSYVLYRRRGYFTKSDVQLSSMQMQKLGTEADAADADDVDVDVDVEEIELGGTGERHIRL